MKLFRNWGNQTKASTVVIGNFDGVHTGHQALLNLAREQAQTTNTELVAMTFEPHPLAVLRPQDAPARILDLRSKLSLLADEQVDQANVMHFTRQFAQISAEDFIDKLIKELGMQNLLVGTDFRFGSGRKGDVALLEQLAKSENFNLVVCKDHLSKDTRVASKLVRQSLQIADFATAKSLLGRPYQFAGRVIHGNKQGRKLGFPTANLTFQGKPTLHGVYAAWIIIDDRRHQSALAIGNRPAIGGTKLTIESHVINFEKDIYGKYISVEPIKKIRDEKDYPDIESLISAIQADIIICKQALHSI